MEPWEDWYKFWRRRFPFAGFFGDEIFREMEAMEKRFRDMEKEMERMMERVPKNLVRERKLPDGTTVREVGPIVYGYSVTIGPEGKPVFREFGNVKRLTRPTAFGLPAPELKLTEEREPLVDTIVEPEAVRVVAEVPGVDKRDIKINCTENSLTISVDTDKRKYYKQVELPEAIDPESAKASYNNGVLEIAFNRLKKARGKELKVE